MGFLDIADRVEKLLWIGQVAHARVVIHVLERVDLEGAPVFTADQTARFVRRLAARLRDELLDLG
jgi:hypothetical protein